MVGRVMCEVPTAQWRILWWFLVGVVGFLSGLSPAVASASVPASGLDAGTNLVISELVSRNGSGLRDEDGETSDWVEIHNPSSRPVSISGWHLTDEVEVSDKWRFPDVELAAGGYLVVFASGKDRRVSDRPLHANFRLSGEGEYLGLIAPGGAVNHEFSPAFPALDVDQAFGFGAFADGAMGAAGTLSSPTPGGPNTALDTSVSERPVFSHGSQTFSDRLELTLSIPSGNGEIRYTLDRRVPSAASPLYREPLVIESTVEVRARVVVPGRDPGPVVSASFVRLADDLVDFSSDLPIVVVDNYVRSVINEGRERPTFFAIFEPGETGRSRLTDPPTLDTRAGIQVRGSSSTGRPKKSYAVEFWADEANVDRDLAPLGMPADSDWVLYGAYQFDRALIRNALVYELSNRVGRYAPRTRFVEVFVNESGEDLSMAAYHGVYSLIEKIKRGPDRVDIEPMSVTADTEPEIQGGYIVKIDRADPGDRGFTGGGQQLRWVEPKEEEINAAQSAYLRTYLNTFNSLLRGRSNLDPSASFEDYIDTGSWVDHHLLNEFTKNPDGFRLSAYMFKPRFGKLQAGPVWDFDRTMGPDNDSRAANPRGWSEVRNYGWWSNLLRDVEFQQTYTDRWQQWRRGPFATENLLGLVDEMATEIQEAQARNFTRWRGVGIRAGGWEQEIEQLKSWLDRRAQFFDSAHTAPPTFSRDSGLIESGVGGELGDPAITLSSERHAIRYRLDGLDPRLPGGAVREGSVLLEPGTHELAIKGTTRILARAVWTTAVFDRWSGPVERIYVTGPVPKLTITELMYHPSPDPDGAYDDDRFEFLELRNDGDTAVDLVGLEFTAGIGFRFPQHLLPPGSVAVLAKDRQAFARRYPDQVEMVIGEFQGSLDNGGETLRLVDAAGRGVLELEYDDRGDWPIEADGQGPSLELANPGASSPAERWRASPSALGSPGIHRVESRHIRLTDITRDGDSLMIRFTVSGGNGIASEPAFDVLHRSRVDVGPWELVPAQLVSDVPGATATWAVRVALEPSARSGFFQLREPGP